MSRLSLNLSTLVALLLLASAGLAGAQDAPEPLDRYQRDPLPKTRLGDEVESAHGPLEPQFQDVPDFEEDQLPPIEDDGEGGLPLRMPTPKTDSAPPPAGAFSPEPDAFGPPRGTFRLPSSIGAPGMAVPAKKPKVSNGAAAKPVPTPGAPHGAMDVPAEAKAEFETGRLPGPEEWQVDERAARERELAIPDEYLDPTWPDDGSGSRIAPEESDSVEDVPLGDDAEMDQAERDETERYKEALGINAGSDEFKQDDWGDTPADHTRERDKKEYEDPAEW